MNEFGLQHERALVEAFIQKNRQERCLFLVSHPARRRDFTSQLARFKWFDSRWAAPIPPKVAHTADQITTLLRQKGAGNSVWAISEDPSLDAREFPLEKAVKETWGGSMGTILSCIPGKLAFFRGEEMNSELLLEHP